MNTNAVSLVFLRATGWVADVVQRQQRGFRRDLFEIGDVLCFLPRADEVRLLNACRQGRDLRVHQAHYAHHPMLAKWIAGGDRTFCLYAWARVKPRGKRAHLSLVVWRATPGGEWEMEQVVACRMDGTPMTRDQDTRGTLVLQKPK